jgi:preprotein translocase subunit SecD
VTVRYRHAVLLLAVFGVVTWTAPVIARAAAGDTGTLTVVLSPTGKYPASTLDLMLTVVESRIDRLGVVNPSVSRHGTDVVFHLPGVTDTTVARRLVVPAELRFRPVLARWPASQNTSVPTDPTARAAVASCDSTVVASLASIPMTLWTDDKSDACVVLPDHGGQQYYLDRAGITGKAIAVAKAQFVSGQGWTVKMELTDAGSAQWDRLARQQFHKQIAIELDGIVQSAPTIQPIDSTFTSFGGTAVISGSFSKTEAKDLAKLINYGSLPPFFKVKQATVN